MWWSSEHDIPLTPHSRCLCAGESVDVKDLRVDARWVIHVQEVGAASTANAAEQNTFRDSQRVARPSVGPRRIPRGRRERSRGGGGCIHQLRAQVLGGAVIKFLLTRSRIRNHQSTNGGRMRQRDAGRAVLISSQRQIQSVRHKSAGIYRLSLRHHCQCRHDSRHTEENPRKLPCTALSRIWKKRVPTPTPRALFFVLPHIVLACPLGKRDDANGVWWIPV